MVATAKTKMVYGVGVNDAWYSVRVIGGESNQMCPYYQRWANMLKRCYNASYISRNPGYASCRVDSRWHRFSEFRGWMCRENWKGLELDKDLLGDGTLYSPETCVFVSKEVNCFTNDRGRCRGMFAVGVCRHRSGRFLAQMRSGGKQIRLGVFDTEKQASCAWVEAKRFLAMEIASRQSDPRVACGLRRFAERLNASDEKTEIILESVK